jgi:hypothetical protein
MKALYILLDNLNIIEKKEDDVLTDSLFKKISDKIEYNYLDKNSKELIVAVLYVHIKYGIPITYSSSLLNLNKYEVLKIKRKLHIKTNNGNVQKFAEYMFKTFKTKIKIAPSDTYPSLIAKFALLKKAKKDEDYKKNIFGYSPEAIRYYFKKNKSG